MPIYSFADAHCHAAAIAGGLPPYILHITAGYSHESNAANARVAEQYENVHLCAGIAPQEAMRHKDVKMMLPEWEDAISKFPKLVAIGEIGLDFHWAKTDEERFLQHECFISQLVLAERLGLPVVVHSRDAEEKCLEILSNFNLPFMMHCYSGSAETAAAAVGTGRAIISVPPIHNKERKKYIRELPLEKLVAESDAPYIGKTSEDALESIKMIAEIKGVGEEAAKQQTLQNTISFFRIK
ncbi:Tat-linked quality control protein TatD [uncultured archaeon]|nr:Tat-linked quality control protein TatD [uncultured archaeon]